MTWWLPTICQVLPVRVASGGIRYRETRRERIGREKNDTAIRRQWIRINPFGCVVRASFRFRRASRPRSGLKTLGRSCSHPPRRLIRAFLSPIDLMVGRPLRRTEDAIEQLGRLELEIPLQTHGGPLLARVQAALRRMAEAVHREQATTRRHLSELTSANERLKLAQTELVSAARLATVGELAAAGAHEIGNPLAGILGYLSIARHKGGQTPQLRECLESIDSEVHPIYRIVRRLLALG